jgi:acetyl esterase/lipase
MTADVDAEFEWPPLLRRAPLPLTVSVEARQALQRSTEQLMHRSLSVQRARCDAVQTALGSRQLARYGVTMTEGEIAGVPVRVFEANDRSQRRDGVVLLNLHGGGFTKDAGSITENAPIAALANCKVVAVRYRMAPEFRFPAAIDDSEKVYRTILEETGPGRIGLYGTSSGATLCVQLIARLQERNRALPSALGFFSGTADLGKPGDTELFFRSEKDASRGGELYAPYLGDQDPTHPSVSPILAQLGSFPPTLCIAGTRDFMLSQTAVFHRALLKSGVHAELVVFEAMLHAHWIYQDTPESDEAFAHMADFFNRFVGPGAKPR